MYVHDKGPASNKQFIADSSSPNTTSTLKPMSHDNLPQGLMKLFSMGPGVIVRADEDPSFIIEVNAWILHDAVYIYTPRRACLVSFPCFWFTVIIKLLQYIHSADHLKIHYKNTISWVQKTNGSDYTRYRHQRAVQWSCLHCQMATLVEGTRTAH